MSHSSGKVLVGDEVVGYFEYNGTVDVACTRISASLEEVAEHWRSPENQRACTCGGDDVAVRLEADYGNGIEWESRACLSCRAIVGERSPYQWST